MTGSTERNTESSAGVAGPAPSREDAALEERITRLVAGDGALEGERAEEARAAVAELLEALERGRVRAARRGPDGWEAVAWVKQGILLAFKVGRTRTFEAHPPSSNTPFGGSTFHYADRDTLPLRPTDGPGEGVRIVPGGVPSVPAPTWGPAWSSCPPPT